MDQALPNRHQYNKTPGFFNELFYWSPDCIDLLTKQAHTIKKFLATAEPTSPWLTSKFSPRNSVAVVKNQIKYLINDGVNRLIYPAWRPIPYQIKPASIVFTDRDRWFYNLPDSDPAKAAWKKGLEYRWQQTPDQFKYEPTDIAKGFKLLHSKYYDLGTA